MLRRINQGVQASRYSEAAARTQQTILLPQSTRTPQTTRNYLVYILSSLELGCAGVRQGVRAIHPSIWGPKKHLQMRRTHEVGSRWICILAPARLATFFGMGMDISERPLHRRLGLLLRLGGPAPVRTCKLQSSVMAELRNGEGETLRVGTSDRHPQKAQTLYTQWRPFLHTLHTAPEAAWRHEDQSKNGATGPEIRVRWGGIPCRKCWRVQVGGQVPSR